MTTVPDCRLGLLDPLCQGVLGVPLQARVDGEGDVVAVDGRHQRALAHRDDGAVAALLEGLLARGADEVLLHHQLDPAAGLAVAGHVADQRRGRRALRVGALGTGLAPVAVDAGDAQRRDRVPGERGDVAAEDAVAAGAGEVGHQLGDRGVEQRRELGGRLLHGGLGGGGVAGVLPGAVGAHRRLVGDDDLAHHARGEHGAVGGEHLPAHGGDDLGGLALELGLLGDRGGVEALDAHQLGGEDAEHEQAGDGEEAHPAARVARRGARAAGRPAAAGPARPAAAAGGVGRAALRRPGPGTRGAAGSGGAAAGRSRPGGAAVGGPRATRAGSRRAPGTAGRVAGRGGGARRRRLGTRGRALGRGPLRPGAPGCRTPGRCPALGARRRGGRPRPRAPRGRWRPALGHGLSVGVVSGGRAGGAGGASAVVSRPGRGRRWAPWSSPWVWSWSWSSPTSWSWPSSSVPRSGCRQRAPSVSSRGPSSSGAQPR